MEKDIEKIRQDIVFDATLHGEACTFHSTWGLFSPTEIDEGSRLLIEHLTVRPDALSLDIGCGYGALGIPLAKLSPQGTVHMVDKDFVAVEYVKKNAALNRAPNCEIYLSNGFSKVPNIAFDLIVSNLPAKVGRALLLQQLRLALPKQPPPRPVMTPSDAKPQLKMRCRPWPIRR